MLHTLQLVLVAMTEKIAQYRKIPCPKCGNYAFSFVGDRRKCDGPRGCDYVWDPGEEGRQAIGHREVN